MDRMGKWKPKAGERYLYPCIYGCKVHYDIDTWENRQIDKERYEVSALAEKMLAVAKERGQSD